MHLCHSSAELRKFVVGQLLVDHLGDDPDDLPVYSCLLKKETLKKIESRTRCLSCLAGWTQGRECLLGATLCVHVSALHHTCLIVV